MSGVTQLIIDRKRESNVEAALFSKTLFTELIQLKGMSGAKEIIKRHASEAHFVQFFAGRGWTLTLRLISLV